MCTKTGVILLFITDHAAVSKNVQRVNDYQTLTYGTEAKLTFFKKYIIHRI